MRILIVEDSAVLRDSLAQGLREAGYAVDAVADGKRGLIYAQTTDYDVIVLDWMLPEMDGLTVLAKIREKRIPAAILMLTAKDTLDDKVRGLTTGADDYLVKPFAFKELLARVQALTRRRHGERSPVVRIGPLTIDTSAKTAHVARGHGAAVALASTGCSRTSRPMPESPCPARNWKNTSTTIARRSSPTRSTRRWRPCAAN